MCFLKEWVDIDLVNMVGIYTINVSMMSSESKENTNSVMWYALIIKVGFSQQKTEM